MNSREDTAEEMMRELEDKAIEVIQSQIQRDQRLKKAFLFKQRNSALQGNFKHPNTRVIEISKEKFEKIVSDKMSRYDENHKCRCPRRSPHSKQEP